MYLVLPAIWFLLVWAKPVLMPSCQRLAGELGRTNRTRSESGSGLLLPPQRPLCFFPARSSVYVHGRMGTQFIGQPENHYRDVIQPENESDLPYRIG